MTPAPLSSPGPPPRNGEPWGVVIAGSGAKIEGPLFAVVGGAAGCFAVYHDAAPGMLLGGLVFLVGLGATLFGYRLRRGERLLWKHGELCKGRVLKSWDSTSGNRGTKYYVQYRYDSPEGPCVAQYETTTPWDCAQVSVVYDPADPSHSIPSEGAEG